MKINKRYIVDKNGVPQEVILSIKDFKKIEALLGIDKNNEKEFWLDSSKPSLNTVWDNTEDDVYEQLLEE